MMLWGSFMPSTCWARHETGRNGKEFSVSALTPLSRPRRRLVEGPAFHQSLYPFLAGTANSWVRWSRPELPDPGQMPCFWGNEPMVTDSIGPLARRLVVDSSLSVRGCGYRCYLMVTSSHQAPKANHGCGHCWRCLSPPMRLADSCHPSQPQGRTWPMFHSTTLLLLPRNAHVVLFHGERAVACLGMGVFGQRVYYPATARSCKKFLWHRHSVSVVLDSCKRTGLVCSPCFVSPSVSESAVHPTASGRSCVSSQHCWLPPA